MYFLSSVLVQRGNTWKYLPSGVDIDLAARVWEWIQEGGWWRNVRLSVLLFRYRDFGFILCLTPSLTLLLSSLDDSKFRVSVDQVSKQVKSLSRVRLFVTPWTLAYQSPPSMGFSRQQYWSGVPFPSPGDLPHPGIRYSGE